MWGEIFNIEGKTFFAFGGFSSHNINDEILEKDDPRVKEWRYRTNKMFRINHVSWWKEGLPSRKEMDNRIQNLKGVNNKVDFIITHSPFIRLFTRNYAKYRLLYVVLWAYAYKSNVSGRKKYLLIWTNY